MQVFKLCMKIIKKKLPMMMIYINVFLAVSLAMSLASVKDQQKVTSFKTAKNNIALITYENTVLIDGLKNELGKIANFVEIKDEREALQDALFYRSVSYILRVPAGFTEKFMKGEDLQLEKTIIPYSINNTYMDMSINKYLNTARLYLKQINGITQEQLVSRVAKDLAVSVPVELLEGKDKPADQVYSNFFFNYSAYSLLFILILGMSELILLFNDHDIKRRNACSPLSTMNANLQFITANLVLTVAAWLFMVTACLVFNFKNSFNINTLYFMLNSFIFALCGASISLLIGNLVKSRNAISAVSNVVILGSCFMSGVFVPQNLLGASVLKIASFTPTYWFVKTNNQIADLVQFDFSHIKALIPGMMVQVGFTIAFFAVALVIGKKKRFS